MEDKKITKILEDISKKIDQAATQKQVNQVGADLITFKDEVMTQLDRQSVILQRLDQGRVFTLDRVRILEADVQSIKL